MFRPYSPKARFETARGGTKRDEDATLAPALPSETRTARVRTGWHGTAGDTLCRVRIPAGSQPLARGKEGLRVVAEAYFFCRPVL